MHRLFACIVLVVLGLSAAAQAANAAPACSQSMITGKTWQALFFHPIGLAYFACPVSISSNGTLTPGSCTFPSGMSAPQPPSGTSGFSQLTYLLKSDEFTSVLQRA
jgi:hypothetical protein